MPSEEITEVERLIASYQERRRRLALTPSETATAAATRYRAFLDVLRAASVERRKQFLEALLGRHAQALQPHDAAESFLVELIDQCVRKLDQERYSDLPEILESVDQLIIFLSLRLEREKERERTQETQPGFDEALYKGLTGTGLGLFLLGEDLLWLFFGSTSGPWMGGSASILTAVTNLLLIGLPGLLGVKSRRKHLVKIGSHRKQLHGEAAAPQVDGTFIDEHTIVTRISNDQLEWECISETPPPGVGSQISLPYKGKTYEGEMMWSIKLGEHNYRFLVKVTNE